MTLSVAEDLRIKAAADFVNALDGALTRLMESSAPTPDPGLLYASLVAIAIAVRMAAKVHSDLELVLSVIEAAAPEAVFREALETARSAIPDWE